MWSIWASVFLFFLLQCSSREGWLKSCLPNIYQNSQCTYLWCFSNIQMRTVLLTELRYHCYSAWVHVPVSQWLVQHVLPSDPSVEQPSFTQSNEARPVVVGRNSVYTHIHVTFSAPEYWWVHTAESAHKYPDTPQPGPINHTQSLTSRKKLRGLGGSKSDCLAADIFHNLACHQAERLKARLIWGGQAVWL